MKSNRSNSVQANLMDRNNLQTEPTQNESLHQNFKQTSSSFDNLRVVIRIRPPLPREIEADLPFRSIALVSSDGKSCSLVEYLGSELNEGERQREWVNNPSLFQFHHFTFDSVFHMDCSQNEVYEVTAKPAVMSILEGYNSTIFAYGQTGTGKTYSMEGFAYNNVDSKRGIIPRSIEEIFNYIESFSNSNTKFMVRASYLQIYNENVSDLLKNERVNLQIREDKKKGVFVDGLSEWAVRTPSDIYSLLQRGALNRATSATKMNDVSSRSHAVFVIIVEQMSIFESEKKSETKTQIKVGKLNLVDLAGSERIRLTGATGKQLEESKKINRSLSALGNVIYALTEARTHIPYRDSKLTRLLEDSLGGNCKTTMMAMISPSHDFFSETLSTLHFARRAKNIKNRPKINEDVDHKALIRQYEVELKKLRCELEEKNRLIKSNEMVVQLEEQKKRAEEDKQAAIYALEQASRQYLQEREEKKKLEQKISVMNSQMIVGGQKIEDTPQFRNLLEEKQSNLRKEFDQKLQEIEKERVQIEEEKAQSEKYKLLLMKQRDIMIALTTKLNERDEAIVQLQEEIEAYDKINKEQEDLIEKKISKISYFETLLKRNNIKFNDDFEEKIFNVSKKVTERIYLPYQTEKLEKDKDFDNSPKILLSSEEKINELNVIVKELENELEVMKMINSQISGGQQNIDANTIKDLKEMKLQLKNNETEKDTILRELFEANEEMTVLKEENKELNDQIGNINKLIEEDSKFKFEIGKKIKTEAKSVSDKVLNLINLNRSNFVHQELNYFQKNLEKLIENLLRDHSRLARDPTSSNLLNSPEKNMNMKTINKQSLTGTPHNFGYNEFNQSKNNFNSSNYDGFGVGLSNQELRNNFMTPGRTSYIKDNSLSREMNTNDEKTNNANLQLQQEIRKSNTPSTITPNKSGAKNYSMNNNLFNNFSGKLANQGSSSSKNIFTGNTSKGSVNKNKFVKLNYK